MAEQDLPAPRPAADLIRRCRLARNLSPEQAAPLTGGVIKSSRWRQIEQGFAPARGGGRKSTRVEPAIWAHMAHAVGATPEQLTEAGEPEAAGILEEILRQRATAAPDGNSASPGDELIAIRTRIPRWADRAAFAADTNLGWELATRAETGDWVSFTPAERAEVERAYGLGPGGLDRLAGGQGDTDGQMAALAGQVAALREEFAAFRDEMARRVTAVPPPANGGSHQREAS